MGLAQDVGDRDNYDAMLHTDARYVYHVHRTVCIYTYTYMCLSISLYAMLDADTR